MFKKILQKKPQILSEKLSLALFADHREADRMMLVIIYLHWLAASTLMAWPYGFYLLGFLGGGVVTLLCTIAYALYRGEHTMRILVGISLMIFSAIFIQQHLGRIEMHFHVFVALGMLMRYKSVAPLFAGMITVALHHIVFSYCQTYDIHFADIPIKVYNYGQGWSITLIHVAFVILTVVVNYYIIHVLYKQFSNNLLVMEELEERTQEAQAAQEAMMLAKQAADDASQAKSLFIASVSHELRTPLNGIIGYSEMLYEQAQEEGESDLAMDLAKVNYAGKHLLNLINDILDLSKIESGKMELHIEPFDVYNMVREISLAIMPSLEKKNNALELDLADDLGEMHADLMKTRQILFNFLSNATKFTENDTIQLTVEDFTKNDMPWLRFIVKDHGIGINEEQLQRLFKPYAQAGASTSRKYGGTGLGLTISQKVAHMMGGEILVHSEEGKGSAFIVELPRVVYLPVLAA